MNLLSGRSALFRPHIFAPYSKSARLLQQTLDEQRATDKVLTQLAKAVIN
jgi:hypothetical protein